MPRHIKAFSGATMLAEWQAGQYISFNNALVDKYLSFRTIVAVRDTHNGILTICGGSRKAFYIYKRHLSPVCLFVVCRLFGSRFLSGHAALAASDTNAREHAQS